MAAGISRVLQVHTRYRQAGGEDRAVEAERAMLDGAGIEVHQVLFDNADLADGRSLQGDLALAAAAIWSRTAARRVSATIASWRPDVVHVHNTFAAASPSVLRAAHGAGVPVVQTLHNYRLVCPVATLFRDGHPCHDCIRTSIPAPGVVHACVRGSRIHSLVAGTTLVVHRAAGTFSRSVDAFIALTEFQAELLGQAWLPRRRIHIVSNFLEPDPGAGDGSRSGVLYVGRLAPEKGIRVLLEAAQSVPGLVSIAGDGPLKSEVERAAALGIVRYLGHTDPSDTAAAMRQAAAVIVPSVWYEGFPMVVLEAYAAGTPVIASRIGSLAEIVDDGVTGRHVPPHEPSAVANVIRSVTSEPTSWPPMGAEARRRYETRFRGGDHLAALLEVYSVAARWRLSTTPAPSR